MISPQSLLSAAFVYLVAIVAMVAGLGISAPFASAAALPTVSVAMTHPVSGFDPEVAQMIAREITQSMTELSRDVTVYHWQPRIWMGLPNEGYVNPDDLRFKSYVSSRAQDFWDWTKPAAGMMGNGLYAATDPLVSQSYGGGYGSMDGKGNGWALGVISLPAATRLLDVRSTRLFPSPLQIKLQALGCAGRTDLTSFLVWSGQSGDEVCERTFREGVRLSGVQGVVYSWGGLGLNICSIRQDRPPYSIGAYPALVLIDPQLAQNAHVLVSNIPPSEPPSIHELRVRVTHFFHLAGHPESDPWPSLAQSEQPQDMIDWIQSHTYFCDGLNWEDLLPQQFNFNTSELIEKREEIYEMAEALSAKTGLALDPEHFFEVMAEREMSPAAWSSLENDGPRRSELRVLAAHEETQVLRPAQQKIPLSLTMVASWGPAMMAEKKASLQSLLDELNGALDHPERLPKPQRIYLTDPYAFIQDYLTRFLTLAPFGETSVGTADRTNEKVGRKLVDYLAARRFLPPILVRQQLSEVSKLGSVSSLLLMEKCLGKYATARAEQVTQLQATGCGMVNPP